MEGNPTQSPGQAAHGEVRMDTERTKDCRRPIRAVPLNPAMRQNALMVDREARLDPEI